MGMPVPDVKASAQDYSGIKSEYRTLREHYA